MISAKFFKSKGFLTGFNFSGHSGYAESGADIVCASVSSAVQLTVNILDELNLSPQVKVGENSVECKVSQITDTASRIINTLELHFEAILEEFPDTINITISEV